jgi:hypothetical protein
MFRRGIAMTPGIMGAKSATPEKSCTECFAAQIEGDDGPQMDRDGQVSHTGLAHRCGHVADTRTGVARFRA